MAPIGIIDESWGTLSVCEVRRGAVAQDLNEGRQLTSENAPVTFLEAIQEGAILIWLLFFILVLVAFVLWVVSQRRKFARQVGADYERIKRTEGDSAIGQMGENEFRLAYEKALKRRSNKAALWVLLSIPVTIGIPYLLVVNSDGGIVLLLAMVVCIGGVVAAVYWGLKSQPSVLDIMREESR